MSIEHKKSYQRLFLYAGFTLIELMVVIAIITILMTVMLSGRSDLTDRLNLKNQAYELSGMIRQAQAYSLGVRSASGEFNISYGVSFDRDTSSTAVFFADKNRNGKYDSAGGEAIQIYAIPYGITLNRMYGRLPSGAESDDNVFKLVVTFNRPSPSAVVKLLNHGGDQVDGRLAPGRVVLKSPKGSEISVIIDSSGQVGIQ
jgi:prepilin-type N-terminal cleavage/methylation domain-containing protein